MFGNSPYLGMSHHPWLILLFNRKKNVLNSVLALENGSPSLRPIMLRQPCDRYSVQSPVLLALPSGLLLLESVNCGLVLKELSIQYFKRIFETFHE